MKVLKEDVPGSEPGEAWPTWAAVTAVSVSPLWCRVEAELHQPSSGGKFESVPGRPQPTVAAADAADGGGGDEERQTAMPEQPGDARSGPEAVDAGGEATEGAAEVVPPQQVFGAKFAG